MSQHSPDLVALLDRHRQADTITRKAFATAIDVSDRTADRVFVDGWEDFDKLKSAVANLPLSLAFDLLTIIAGDRFAVAHRGAAADGCNGVEGALRIADTAAEMGMKILKADVDKIRTHEESSEIQGYVNHIRRFCDAVEEHNRKLTPRARHAG